MKRTEYQAKPQHLRGFCPGLILSLTGISNFPLLYSRGARPHPQCPLFQCFSCCPSPHSSWRVCALESHVPWERALLTSPAFSHVQTPPKLCPAVALQIYLAKDKILLSPPPSNDWHRCLIQGLGSQVLRWAKVVFVHPVPLMSALSALRETN